MSSYQALYRKWRPRNFRELVGQEHVARTLSNALEAGQLAHAYLFTGPRGTGKTSTARIFAKSLNCQHQEGPTLSPCEACDSCREIAAGRFPDVIEIDAASNRGVDDARDLRERVRFAPTRGRYKVFIVDEVHMLTNEAFNALLKTIEEPPERLVFILATTDVHKVPATIISRCQRFDFQRIAFAKLVAHLGQVAAAEGLQVDPAGIETMARRADGGLRDALSLLDQVRSSSATSVIGAEDVFAALGLISGEAVGEVARAIADQKIVPALEATHALLARGYDHHAVVRELMELFRHLMLTALSGERGDALGIPQDMRQAIAALVPRFTLSEQLYAMEVLREAETMLKGSNQMTIWLEMALIRLCHRTDIPSLTDLTRRVTALEERLAMGPGPVRGTRAPAPAAAPSPPTPTPSVTAPSGPDGEPAVTSEDALSRLLVALARVHKGTQSLVQQHARYARLEQGILVVGVRSTVSSFFDRSDRMAWLNKAVAAAFGDGVRLRLSYETGDPPSPRPADAGPLAPAAPAPVPAYPPRAIDPGSAAPEATRPVIMTDRTETIPGAPALAPEPVAPGERDPLEHAVSIFHGRIVEPTL